MNKRGSVEFTEKMKELSLVTSRIIKDAEVALKHVRYQPANFRDALDLHFSSLHEEIWGVYEDFHYYADMRMIWLRLCVCVSIVSDFSIRVGLCELLESAMANLNFQHPEKRVELDVRGTVEKMLSVAPLIPLKKKKECCMLS